MPFRTNYRQERAQRTRSRESKQQEKLARREEATAKRKALREGEPAGAPESQISATDDPASPQGG
jgi:hypothetical protein